MAEGEDSRVPQDAPKFQDPHGTSHFFRSLQYAWAAMLAGNRTTRVPVTMSLGKSSWRKVASAPSSAGEELNIFLFVVETCLGRNGFNSWFKKNMNHI